MESVAIITGANSGVGLALAKRLLSEVATENRPIRLCLACRNTDKAEKAKQYLLQYSPTAAIDVLQVDTSDPDSAINAAQQIKEKYPHVNWLFCNAGIMPVGKLNIKNCLTLNKTFWTTLLTTGEGLLNHEDWTLGNNLKAVFATNVLGHYIMIKELEEYLMTQSAPCHIIWTSSNSAKTAAVDPNDIQDCRQCKPYPNSKMIIDMISVDINRRLNSHGIYSDTTCPGNFVSQITLNLLPMYIWYLLLPIIFLVRLFITHFINFKPENGAEALISLARQDPVNIDHSIKYFSRTTSLGSTYVHRERILYDERLLSEVVKQVNELAEFYTEKNRSE